MVEAKTKGQLRLLRRALERRLDKRRPITRAISQLETLLDRIADDAQPPDIASLLGKAARQRFYTRFHPLGAALHRLLRRQMRAVAREFEERGRGVPSPAPAGESQP